MSRKEAAFSLPGAAAPPAAHTESFPAARGPQGAGGEGALGGSLWPSALCGPLGVPSSGILCGGLYFTDAEGVPWGPSGPVTHRAGRARAGAGKHRPGVAPPHTGGTTPTLTAVRPRGHERSAVPS